MLQQSLQMQTVLRATCQWTQRATESFTIHHRWHGSLQVTSVCLVVDRWLFSLTLDVCQTTDNLLTGWILLILIGSDLWDTGGRQLVKVGLSCSVNGLRFLMTVGLINFMIRAVSDTKLLKGRCGCCHFPLFCFSLFSCSLVLFFPNAGCHFYRSTYLSAVFATINSVCLYLPH